MSKTADQLHAEGVAYSAAGHCYDHAAACWTRGEIARSAAYDDAARMLETAGDVAAEPELADAARSIAAGHRAIGRVTGPTVTEAPHAQDEDCAPYLDPETDTCRVCGVDHSGQCPTCQGRGFHRPDCADQDEDCSDHAQDEDCAPYLDPETDTCTVCGVVHRGLPCAACGGRGFHRPDCDQERRDQERADAIAAADRLTRAGRRAGHIIRAAAERELAALHVTQAEIDAVLATPGYSRQPHHWTIFRLAKAAGRIGAAVLGLYLSACSAAPAVTAADLDPWQPATDAELCQWEIARDLWQYGELDRAPWAVRILRDQDREAARMRVMFANLPTVDYAGCGR